MMTSNSDYLTCLLMRLAQLREQARLTPAQVEKTLILGPGWISAIEAAQIIPSLDVVASLLSLYGKNLADLAVGITGSVSYIHRSITATPEGNNLIVHFTYGQYNAKYQLENADIEQFKYVLSTLRNGLSQLSQFNIKDENELANSIKSDSVATTFLTAVRCWPLANPSDIWWFIVYRAYCDPYNHPSEHSKLDFTQSWKRTGGWALEKILVAHYSPILEFYGINLIIADNERKTRLLGCINIEHRLEADKMDVLLTVGNGAAEKLIGVVHVKASFAERRTDDVPMSHALVKAGYISPLWTMDCKSMPSEFPINRGELGQVHNGINDNRSAKRKDIEDDGFFSACFSYNLNTQPTPPSQITKARIEVCNFSSPDDAFTYFIVTERERVRRQLRI